MLNTETLYTYPNLAVVIGVPEPPLDPPEPPLKDPPPNEPPLKEPPEDDSPLKEPPSKPDEEPLQDELKRPEEQLPGGFRYRYSKAECFVKAPSLVTGQNWCQKSLGYDKRREADIVSTAGCKRN